MKRTFLKIALAGLMTGLVSFAMSLGARTLAFAAAPPVLSAPSTAAASASGPPSRSEDQPATAVKIDNFTFTPSQLTVAAGTTVRWTNQDDVPHTIVADDKSFKSKALDTDDVFTYTFTKPGTYKYFCGLHPKMTATVVVK